MDQRSAGASTAAILAMATISSGSDEIREHIGDDDKVVARVSATARGNAFGEAFGHDVEAARVDGVPHVPRDRDGLAHVTAGGRLGGWSCAAVMPRPNLARYAR